MTNTHNQTNKIKPIFIRAIEYLGQLQIDVRRIETTPTYLRTPWMKSRYEQIDQSLCAIPKRSLASDSVQKQQRYWKKNTTNIYKSTLTAPKKTKKLGAW
jgi:hypothetical protein